MIPMMDFSGCITYRCAKCSPIRRAKPGHRWGNGRAEKGVLSLIYYSWLMHWGESRRRDDMSAEHTHRSGPRVYYVGQRDYKQSER